MKKEKTFPSMEELSGQVQAVIKNAIAEKTSGELFVRHPFVVSRDLVLGSWANRPNPQDLGRNLEENLSLTFYQMPHESFNASLEVKNIEGKRTIYTLKLSGNMRPRFYYQLNEDHRQKVLKVDFPTLLAFREMVKGATPQK